MTTQTNPSQCPVVLIVRDGWGHNPFPEWDKANATILAKTPVAHRLLAEYPNAQIHTCGEDVGLPTGVMGNSEVGHQNIGAGRIVDQEIMRITRTIHDGSFFTNPTLLAAAEHAKKNHGTFHILGLVSDGRVHSDLDHLYALIDFAKKQSIPPQHVMIHAIMDGRDTAPQSGINFIGHLEGKLNETGAGHIASVIGRYFAMDRDNRWDRVSQAYEMLTRGAPKVMASASTAIKDYYAHAAEPSRSGDEFITATSIADSAQIPAEQLVKAGDTVVFFNYRGDRPRELCKAFVLDDAAWKEQPNGGFDRGQKIENLFFAGMSNYETGLPIQIVFQRPPKMNNILGEYVAGLGLKQFRSAETEKFPHVTFFFNDYREENFPGEDRQIVPSPRDVTTYDQKPEMSAYGVADAVLERINSGLYDLIIVNFANGDMVGHTGNLAAAIKAVEVVDECVGKIVAATQKQGGALVITADHGNCEQMIDPATGGPHTAHTTYDVDLIVVDDKRKAAKLRAGGRLADIAPTLLDLMGLAKPEEMTGISLLA